MDYIIVAVRCKDSQMLVVVMCVYSSKIICLFLNFPQNHFQSPGSHIIGLYSTLW